jgi:hypothetical protein
VWDHGERSLAIRVLPAGQSLPVYGRSGDGAWWEVLDPLGWGWVRAEAVDLQSGAEIDAFAIRD